MIDIHISVGKGLSKVRTVKGNQMSWGAKPSKVYETYNGIKVNG